MLVAAIAICGWRVRCAVVKQDAPSPFPQASFLGAHTPVAAAQGGGGSHHAQPLLCSVGAGREQCSPGTHCLMNDLGLLEYDPSGKCFSKGGNSNLVEALARVTRQLTAFQPGQRRQAAAAEVPSLAQSSFRCVLYMCVTPLETAPWQPPPRPPPARAPRAGPWCCAQPRR